MPSPKEIQTWRGPVAADNLIEMHLMGGVDSFEFQYHLHKIARHDAD